MNYKMLILMLGLLGPSLLGPPVLERETVKVYAVSLNRIDYLSGLKPRFINCDPLNEPIIEGMECYVWFKSLAGRQVKVYIKPTDSIAVYRFEILKGH